MVDPHAARTDVPLWIGGRTRRSLRRAVELGDGWSPFAVSLDDVTRMLAWARSRPEWARRDTPVDVMVSLTLDPLTGVDSARRELDAAERAGVTHVAASFVADSRDHYEEHVAALVSLER